MAYTSSVGVYDDATEEVRTVTEGSPLSSSPRAQRLLALEEAVRAEGGRVLRLAGLYHSLRGARHYFLTRGLQSDPDGLVNQIHYEDAASLVLAVLQHPSGSTPEEAQQVFLGCDDEPLTRRELLQGCRDAGPRRGKRCDCSATQGVLGWQPRHRSFATFMQEQEQEQHR